MTGLSRRALRATAGVAMTAAAVTLVACAGMRPTAGPSAKAILEPTQGNTASGTATFTQKGNRVQVVADVRGLKPNQEHGFHVHDKGDCSSGDGMSTGGHFNPLSKPHAHPSSADRHAGDMLALKADASGNASASVEVDTITVAEGPTSVVGRGLIVHAQPDDYRTQPTGNAGARIACGVIRRS
jgi:superoxide dismutase, Cu-Zn family